jgi:hypothetical protein
MRSNATSLSSSGTFTLYPSGATISAITGIPVDSTNFAASYDMTTSGQTTGQAQELYSSVANSWLDVNAEL